MVFYEVLVGMSAIVTVEMNLELDKNFIGEEVFKALKQMASLTAPGPDGMSPIFYKKNFTLLVGMLLKLS